MRRLHIMTLLACVALYAAPAAAQTEAGDASVGDPESPLPVSHYIEGVPFVSWGEAADYEYPNKNVLNPSYIAASHMTMRYWGIPVDATTGMPPDDIPGLENEVVENATLDNLKRAIAGDLPVKIRPAITAHAHYLYFVVKMMGMLSETPYEVEQTGPTSGLFGEMVSVDSLLDAVSKGCDRRVINDSVFLAVRIVVGYDDTREVLLIHDPVFGPDWEVPYDDFLAMWRFVGNEMNVMLVKGADGKPEPHPSAIAHPPRSVDHDAAFALFNGYSLAAVNKLADAEAELRRGLALPGISDRYGHLLRLELGSLLGKTGRADESVRLLREATAIFPDHFRAWGELGNVYKCCVKDRQASRNAKTAYANAKKLCTEKVERKVAGELGRDFFVVGCDGAYLGWAKR